MSSPFHNSQASSDVDDISSISATDLFSLDLPIIALSQGGPSTLMALTIIVITPRGAIARIIQSAQPRDWLRNCMVTLSPNKANNLINADLAPWK
jgi:hypothetical protein